MVAQAQAANSIATDSGSSTADLASSAGLSSDEESKAEKQMKLQFAADKQSALEQGYTEE